jgi:hypothetical protein
MAFLTRNKTKLCKFFIITLDFEKNANFFAENWQKSQKIVIITSTSETEQKIKDAVKWSSEPPLDCKMAGSKFSKFQSFN